MNTPTAEITRCWLLSMQVCVPAEWIDKKVIAFAERRKPCGTTTGWQIRRQGDPLHAGDDERVPCEAPDRSGFVHIVLDA